MNDYDDNYDTLINIKNKIHIVYCKHRFSKI